MTSENRKPIWLYPNLLSLDAPLVAVVWLHMFAQTWRLGYHPWQPYVSLGLAVWAIYVADRLLDASLMAHTPGKLEPRHQFHARHRKWLTVCLVLAVVAAAGIVVMTMPMTIYRYLLMGGVMVAGFFGLSMLSSQDHQEVALTKNIMGGMTFAFGTAMLAHLYRWEFGVMELLISREFICFAVLCVLNIAAIDYWEHSLRVDDEEVKASDEISLTLPLALLGFASLVFAMQESATRPFYYAVMTGAALLFILNRQRAKLSMDALRVLADASLVAPLLVFYAAQAN